MAIAFSTAVATGTTGSSVTGFAVTIPANAVVLVSMASSKANDQVISITDDGGNAYGIVRSQAFGSTGARSHLVYMAQNTQSATQLNVSMTQTGLSLMVGVYTGVVSTGQIPFATGSIASSALTIITQDPNNWLVMFADSDGLATSVAASVGTQRVTQINQGISIDNTVASAGSLTTTASWTGGPPNWSAIGVELRTRTSNASFWKSSGPFSADGLSPVSRFRSTLAYPTSPPTPPFDPSTSPWNPLLPDFFARANWNPQRTESARAGWTQTTWAVPPAKIPEPVLPERFAFPRWAPEKTDVERPASTQATWAIAPTKIPEPVLPSHYARQIWTPERSHVVGIPYLPPTWPTTVVAPEWFARSSWSPERTETARAGWTQALWAIAPTKIPEPVLPENYARPIWNPERSHIFVRQFVVSAVAPTWGYELYGPQALLRPPWNPERSHLARAGWTQATWAVPPQQIPEPVLPATYARPSWSPERSVLLVPQRIVQVPLLSWTPALLDRYVQALRSNPWLDLFLPPFPQPNLVSPPQLIVLVGRQDATATSGQQDTIALLGQQAPAGVQGSQDTTIVIPGRQDTGPLSGSQ